MDPDRSSSIAARRIIEEVLADHAARATALDGAKPVRIVERPDTPSWRAARRIVEETLAEHAARAVVPPAMRLDVVVDLEERDIEVVIDLDGHAPATEPSAGQAATADPSEPGEASVVAPIERDETPAKAARRVVEGMLTEQEIDPDAPTGPDDAPVAFEVDPVPRARPEPPEPIATGGVAPVEPSHPDDPDEPKDPVDQHEADGEVIVVDDARLRAAIPERLFDPDPDPDPESTEFDTPLEGPPELDQPAVAPAADGGSPPPTLQVDAPAPFDPGGPHAVAARIVAEVLADRERAAQEAQDAQAARDAELAALQAETAASEPPEPASARAPDTGPDTVAAAHESPEAQPPHRSPGWTVVASTSELDAPGSASEVMVADAGVHDPRVLDPVVSGTRLDGRPAEATDEFSTGQQVATPADEDPDEDEFGGWPEPIAPPRRAGRWLITTVLGAVLLAVLLPLAIGALRDLVSFS